MKSIFQFVEKPLVSVLIPTYNRMPLLKNALDSVFFQSYTNWEIILINDGSNDSTAEYLSTIFDSRLKIINLEKNLGRVEALNAGLQQCNGRYIARLDSDDTFLPRHLEVSLAYLQKSPNTVLVGSQMFLVGESHPEITHDPTGEDISELFLNGNFINNSTAVFRVLRPINERLFYNNSACEDYDFWVRMIGLGKIANLQVFGALYTRHGGQVSKIVAKGLAEDINRAKKKASLRLLFVLLRKPNLITFKIFKFISAYATAAMRVYKIRLFTRIRGVNWIV